MIIPHILNYFHIFLILLQDDSLFQVESIHLLPNVSFTEFRTCDFSASGSLQNAPTRGATQNIRQEAIRIWISIHAPVKGATALMISIISLYAFQSTLPRGERQQTCIIIVIHIYKNHNNITSFTFHPSTTSFPIQKFLIHIQCESPRIFMCTSVSHYK